MASSMGGPEAGEKTKLISPSSSPLTTPVILGIAFPAAAATSAMNVFRGIVVNRCLWMNDRGVEKVGEVENQQTLV